MMQHKCPGILGETCDNIVGTWLENGGHGIIYGHIGGTEGCCHLGWLWYPLYQWRFEWENPSLQMLEFLANHIWFILHSSYQRVGKRGTMRFNAKSWSNESSMTTGWWLGVPPWLRKPPCMYGCSILYCMYMFFHAGTINLLHYMLWCKWPIW